MPGEVYNIGSSQGHDIETLADLVIKHSGCCPSLATYTDSEPMTTLVKRPDITKAARDLGLHDTVPLDEGVANTIKWMHNPARGARFA